VGNNCLPPQTDVFLYSCILIQILYLHSMFEIKKTAFKKKKYASTPSSYWHSPHQYAWIQEDVRLWCTVCSFSFGHCIVRLWVTSSDYPFDSIKLFLLAIALSFFELRLQITPLIVLNFFTLFVFSSLIGFYFHDR
jgi:hypothetical protein